MLTLILILWHTNWTSSSVC